MFTPKLSSRKAIFSFSKASPGRGHAINLSPFFSNDQPLHPQFRSKKNVMKSTISFCNAVNWRELVCIFNWS